MKIKLPFIVCLFYRCCPSAIFGGVIAVDLFPVNRITVWSWPHISKEIFSMISAIRIPVLADSYPPATVGKKIFMVPIGTSFHHAPKCRIFVGMHKAMADIMFGSLLFKVATTRLSVSADDVLCHNNDGSTTIASTQKMCAAITICGPGDYRKTMKFLTGKVFKCWHNILRWISSVKRSVEGITDMLFGSRLPIHRSYST